MNNPWKATWSGRYPNLCSGTWTLECDGVAIKPSLIPFNEDGAHGTHANTRGTYSRWYFDKDWCEHFEDYEDGLDETAWCEQNKNWLTQVAEPHQWPFIFAAFQASDWRHGSCGGCI